jgi:2-oxoglutarate ferredoxin oxidoreductase subunit delta
MVKRRLKEHRIDPDWCKGCGICVHFCPKKVLELDRDGKAFAARPEDCVCCALCEMRCPDLAIEVVADEVASVIPDAMKKEASRTKPPAKRKAS